MDVVESTLKELLAGNARFAESESPAERAKLASDQEPKAVIIYCSDSRVVAEMIMGVERRGVIFGVRLAGNVVTPEVKGSVVYAMEHLDVPLIIMLGHTGCGAVKAAAGKAEQDADLNCLLRQVKPDVEENVKAQIARLMENETIRKRVHEGKVTVVGAIYDMESNKFAVLDKEKRKAKMK